MLLHITHAGRPRESCAQPLLTYGLEKQPLSLPAADSSITALRFGSQPSLSFGQCLLGQKGPIRGALLLPLQTINKNYKLHPGRKSWKMKKRVFWRCVRK